MQTPRPARDSEIEGGREEKDHEKRTEKSKPELYLNPDVSRYRLRPDYLFDNYRSSGEKPADSKRRSG